MTHSEAARLLGAYVDDELGPEQRAAVEGHIRDCPLCAREVQWMREISDGLHAWTPLARSEQQQQAFCCRVMERLPSREESSPMSKAPARSFILPLGLALSSAMVQATAFVMLVLGLAPRLGPIATLQSWLGTSVERATDSIASVTLENMIGMQLAALFGDRLLPWLGSTGWLVSGWLDLLLDYVVPTLLLTAVLFLIFVALSGWAGLQLSRQRQ